MTQQEQKTAPATGATGRAGGLRLGSLFGIEIRLDPSVVLIFLLIVYSLAGGVFPGWHPDWSVAVRWGTALVAGLLFFASLLAHEFAHSVVAQAYGIRVPRITLFLLGGVSELSAEPRTPKSEFLMAIAGPLMSLLLGVVFSYLGTRVAGGEQFATDLVQDRTAALAALSPLATMLLWLGPVNLMLGIFNMVPGFPLDGGRVLRALIWWLTGNQLRATRWATGAGRLFGWGLMALGIFSLFSGQGLGGLWFVLIGWFLSSSAQSSYTQMWLRQSLKPLHVADLMRTHFETVTPTMPLTTFIDDALLRSQQTLWPVLEGGTLRGWISQADVARVAEEERRRLSVADVMAAPDSVGTLSSDTPGDEAFGQLSSSPDAVLAVLEQGRVVGMLRSADVLRWLSLHHAH